MNRHKSIKHNRSVKEGFSGIAISLENVYVPFASGFFLNRFIFLRRPPPFFLSFFLSFPLFSHSAPLSLLVCLCSRTTDPNTPDTQNNPLKQEPQNTRNRPFPPLSASDDKCKNAVHPSHSLRHQSGLELSHHNRSTKKNNTKLNFTHSSKTA